MIPASDGLGMATEGPFQNVHVNVAALPGVCQYPPCGTPFKSRPKGKPQRFCSPPCRVAFHAEARRRGGQILSRPRRSRRSLGDRLRHIERVASTWLIGWVEARRASADPQREQTLPGGISTSSGSLSHVGVPAP